MKKRLYSQRHNIVIGVLLVCAFTMRVFSVGSIPPALSWDEVSIGYNAWSILQTLKDEHDKFLPLDTFIAYGDYKPPLSIYLTVPFVGFLGLSELAVRLPSAIAGTFSVLLTYLAVYELFEKNTKKYFLGITAGFLLAVSPWSLQLSRAGFEANIAMMFVLLGIVLFLKARSAPKLLLVSFMPFVAAIYTFNSARYFVPLLFLILIVLYGKSYLPHKRRFAIGCFLAVLFVIPIVPHLVSPQARLRYEEVNIFSDLSVVLEANRRAELDGFALWTKIIHNRRIGYAVNYATHFLDHFQPWFLFIRGDGNPKFSIQDVGQLYLIEAPLLVLGILMVFRDHSKTGIFLLLWLLGSIVPAATARETPHALRIANSLPVWQIYISYAIIGLITTAKRRRKVILVSCITAAYIFNISYYLHNYYTHYAREYSGEWQYGYKQAIRYAESVSSSYDQIVVSDTIGRPYMYTLFYTSYDPEQFLTQKESTFDAAGFYHVYGFGKWRFVGDTPHGFEHSTLYILSPESVPGGANILKEVKLLNGNTVLTVFEI